jgi:hypothetical protein
MLPSWPGASPEMDTVTRGGIGLDSSPRRATSDHHELPIKIAVGGGHKNLAKEVRVYYEIQQAM